MLIEAFEVDVMEVLVLMKDVAATPNRLEGWGFLGGGSLINWG